MKLQKNPSYHCVFEQKFTPFSSLGIEPIRVKLVGILNVPAIIVGSWNI